MRKEESFNPESENFNNLIAQYEEMLTTGKSIYFDSSELIDIADYYTETEQYDKAVNALDYGLQLHPDNLELLTMKGSVLLEKRDLEKARALIHTLPDFANYDTSLLKASLAICEKDIDKAEDILEEIERRTGPNADFYIDAAFIYCDGQERHGAMKWFEKAFDISAKDLDALEEYALCCFTYKKFDKIISYYQTFVDNEPYNSVGWFWLSRSYMEKGESGKALDNIDFALAINPDVEAFILLKAAAYYQLENYEASLNLYQELHNKAPENAQYLFLLGLAYYNLEEYKQAIPYLEKASSLSSYSDDNTFKTDLLRTLVWAYKYNHEPNQAINILNRILGNPLLTDTAAYLLKAEFELENQNYPEADKYFRMALSYDESKRAETLLQILDAFENRNMLKEGIKFFEPLCQESPNSVFLSIILAYCHSQLGENEKEQEYTNQAIRIDPDSAALLQKEIFIQKEEDKPNPPHSTN